MWRALPVLLIIACTKPAAPEVPDASVNNTDLTYHSFVRGFIETRCAECHEAGGAAPFALSTWSDVQPKAAQLVDAVLTRRMPPHAPRAGCREALSAAIVSPEDLERLLTWQAAGFPEGDASTYSGAIPLTSELPSPNGEPTHLVTDPEAYAPPAGPDVFRETTVSNAFAEDTWVIATDLVPSAREVVHHANAFVDAPDAPSTVPGPTQLLGAYAPGYGPLVMPPDSALFVPAGSSIIFSVHYSTVAIGDGRPVPAGKNQLRLWTLPAGQRPKKQAFMDAVSQSDLLVPALSPRVDVFGESELRYPGSEIVGVFPHMHFLGTSFKASVQHADGGESCLVDVPDYDFLHQSLILFAPDASVHVGEGDLHRMTCTYDNSQENQPLVNGVPKTSVDAIWGDNSTDEMCTEALLRLVPL